MKKITGLIVIVIIGISIFLLGFNYNNPKEPNEYYQVYLDEKVIGVIKSKEELNKYIDNKGNIIKTKYGVGEVYAPNGLEIKRINTYSNKLSSIKEVYATIEKERPFTIAGFQFTLKNDETIKKIYVTDENIFKNAITATIDTFVGTEKYDAYLSDKQSEIATTGRKIKTVYVAEDITIKQTNIPVTETIYTDSNSLAKFLLFGPVNKQSNYNVKAGDTIETVSFNNKISVEEFLISNTTFTSAKNLLFPGQSVVIGQTDPQIKVVLDEYVVKDIEVAPSIEYVVDSNLFLGQKITVREGKNGLIRVAQNITTVNGNITNVSDPESKQELITPINQIVKVGKKALPTNIGDTDWGWPTNPGWTLSSPYGYRIHPVYGVRYFHNGIDLSGTGRGSNIYVVNNGVVTNVGYRSDYGRYIIVNHNNGYQTLYAHLEKYIVAVGDVVIKGQVIGYMGNTGVSTGTHLHFSVFLGNPFGGAASINPLTLY